MSNSYITIDRSTVGVRDFLFDEMERLANGQIDEKRLKIMAKAGDTILKSAALDITAKKMISDAKNSSGGPKEVADIGLNLMLSDQTKS